MLEPIQAPPPWQRARSLVLRWLISTLAIFVAVYLIPGIGFVGPGWELGIVAAVFGLVNAALRPLLTLLTCPLIILSLGLFGLVINATAAAADRADRGGAGRAVHRRQLSVGVSGRAGDLAGERAAECPGRRDRTGQRWSCGAGRVWGCARLSPGASPRPPPAKNALPIPLQHDHAQAHNGARNDDTNGV